MRTRITISLGLAIAVVLSVFTLLQFERSGSVFADDTSEAASNSSVDIQTIDEVVVDGSLDSGDDNRQSIPADETSPSEPIYVYPDGSLAPAPGTTSAGSARYEDDDDYDDYRDDHDEYDEYDDDDDDERRWWDRLATFDSDDDDDDHDRYEIRRGATDDDRSSRQLVVRDSDDDHEDDDDD